MKEHIERAALALDEHGYAVIDSVYSDEECDALYGEMWRLLEGAGGLRRDLDYATMRADQLPPHKHGILESYRLNHAEFVRAVRAIRV